MSYQVTNTKSGKTLKRTYATLEAARKAAQAKCLQYGEARYAVAGDQPEASAATSAVTNTTALYAASAARLSAGAIVDGAAYTAVSVDHAADHAASIARRFLGDVGFIAVAWTLAFVALSIAFHLHTGSVLASLALSAVVSTIIAIAGSVRYSHNPSHGDTQ